MSSLLEMPGEENRTRKDSTVRHVCSPKDNKGETSGIERHRVRHSGVWLGVGCGRQAGRGKGVNPTDRRHIGTIEALTVHFIGVYTGCVQEFFPNTVLRDSF